MLSCLRLSRLCYPEPLVKPATHLCWRCVRWGDDTGPRLGRRVWQQVEQCRTVTAGPQRQEDWVKCECLIPRLPAAQRISGQRQPPPQLSPSVFPAQQVWKSEHSWGNCEPSGKEGGSRWINICLSLPLSPRERKF